MRPSMRRCVATGQILPIGQMIRCVAGPDNALIADLSETLPGRGLWLSANRAALRMALAKNAFSRAARCKIQVADDFEQRTCELLARRTLQMLGFARKAGVAVCGRAKVDALARAGKIGVLLAASDGAPDGRGKLERLTRAAAPGAAYVSVLGAAELGLAFGREHVIHAAIAPGRLADRFLREANRLSGFRGQSA